MKTLQGTKLLFLVAFCVRFASSKTIDINLNIEVQNKDTVANGQSITNNQDCIKLVIVFAVINHNKEPFKFPKYNNNHMKFIGSKNYKTIRTVKYILGHYLRKG